MQDKYLIERNEIVKDLFYSYSLALLKVFDRIKNNYLEICNEVESINCFMNFLMNQFKISDEINDIIRYIENTNINYIIENKLTNIQLKELFEIEKKTLKNNYKYHNMKEIEYVLVDFLGQVICDIKTLEMISEG